METVHAFDTGSLTANETFLRGEGFRSLLHRVEPVEFPALAFAIEHPEGLLVIDTGLGTHVPNPRTFRGFPPRVTSAVSEIGDQMRARGLDPGDVRRLILTHLDYDHTGGLHHFGHADVLVHRTEAAFARTRMGRARYRPRYWPRELEFSVYDLDPEPYGPFPASRAVTAAGDVRIVPLPGHSPGQVGVVYETGDVTILFAADHMLRAQWFVQDIEAGRLLMLGPFAKRAARNTSRSLQRLVRERPVVLAPSHDAETPGRLARGEMTRV